MGLIGGNNGQIRKPKRLHINDAFFKYISQSIADFMFSLF